MKKIVILLFILLSITGCKSDNSDPVKIEKVPVKNDVIEEQKKEEYIDDNPIKIGLYYYSNGVTRLANEYYSKWTLYKDIGVLTALFTSNETVESNKVANLFDNYKLQYQGIDNYRIGYYIEFSVSSGELVTKLILNPNDAIMPNEYLQFYLYDDIIHRNDSWYSHITMENWNENSFLTSIKITASTYYDQITTPIKITVFTYNGSEDFDESGKYRGNSYFTSYVKNM